MAEWMKEGWKEYQIGYSHDESNNYTGQWLGVRVIVME